MVIDVLYAVWGADGAETPFEGGLHTVEAASDVLIRSIAGAEASGVILVVDCTPAERKLLDGHVQSQADGEAAYAKAQDDGRWQHGNLLQFIADRESILTEDALHPDSDVILAEIDVAKEQLAAVEVPA